MKSKEAEAPSNGRQIMTRKNSFYLLEPFQGIPVANPEEWLARIVSDYRRPHAAFTPKKAREPYFESHNDPDYSNVARVLKDISTTRIRLSLLDVLDISHDAFKTQKHFFQSRRVERLRIHQDADVLEKTLKDKEVDLAMKKWGLDLFNPMYFIVGLLVTNDITYESSEDAGIRTKAEIDPVKAGSLVAGATSPVMPSSQIDATGSHEQPREAKTHASGKRVFAIEYRSFRKHLRQRPGKLGRLRGYGPQGDRTFGPADESEDDTDVHVELDPETFEDTAEIDGEEERCIILDDVSEEAIDSA